MNTGHYNQTGHQLYWVKDNIFADDFPAINRTLDDPDGLLAIGGDLSEKRLLEAYQAGIFPWYNGKQPILWWSPDPRSVLEPTEFHISRSLAKRLRKKAFRITFNTAFSDVLEYCAAPRNGVPDTWITDDMKTAYDRLFKSGYAHSVECWLENKLVGGLYGLALGRVFFGESMFSRVPDASKVTLVHLTEKLRQKEFRIIDCQVHSRHLQSLGAKLVSRNEFKHILDNDCSLKRVSDWGD